MGKPFTIRCEVPLMGPKIITSELFAQVRGVAQSVVRDVGVGNLEMVERDAVPAFVLRVLPGVD